MTFEQVIQLAGLIVTGLTTWKGYAAVTATLTNYVPVDVYRAKVSELHEQINGLRVEVAVLLDRKERAQ